MKIFFCFSKAFRNKIGVDGKLFILSLLPLLFCLSACPTSVGSGAGKGSNQEPKPQPQFVPKEGNKPAESELEVISKEEIFGTYTGTISVTMDGKKYGPYTETVVMREKPSGDISFVSRKIVYNGNMPVDIGYMFDKTALSPDSEVTLTPTADGKSFSFTGKKATMLYYTQNDNTSLPKEVPSNTSVDGVIYKQKGAVHIRFSVHYDTDATRKAFPTMPQGIHKSMSSTMINGTKK